MDRKIPKSIPILKVNKTDTFYFLVWPCLIVTMWCWRPVLKFWKFWYSHTYLNTFVRAGISQCLQTCLYYIRSPGVCRWDFYMCVRQDNHLKLSHYCRTPKLAMLIKKTISICLFLVEKTALARWSKWIKTKKQYKNYAGFRVQSLYLMLNCVHGSKAKLIHN